MEIIILLGEKLASEKRLCMNEHILCDRVISELYNDQKLKLMIEIECYWMNFVYK